MDTIRVVTKRPGFKAEIVTIPNTLAGLQGQLDGACICGIRLDAEVSGYCDDEGLIKGLPLNFHLHGEPIVGPAVFSACNDEGEEIGLTEEQALRVCRVING